MSASAVAKFGYSIKIPTPPIVVDYVPPERSLDDVFLAFRDLQEYRRFSAYVEPDPLGPVNSIVSLVSNTPYGPHRVKSLLCPVRSGARISVGKCNVFDGHVQPTGEWPAGGWALRPAWCVAIDGKRVIVVPEDECQPPAVPRQPVPWRQRARRAAREAARRRFRAALDPVAHRLGYVREDDMEPSW